MADDEIVVLVNERNDVIGAAPRLEMRTRRLIHRATYIFVFNSGGALFVQKRTSTKDMYPGYYDLAAGGVVQAGETYEESAQREAQEELGIVDTPLSRRFDFYYEDELNRIWGRTFACRYDGQFVLQAEEVASGEFRSTAEIRTANLTPVTPDTVHAFELLMREKDED